MGFGMQKWIYTMSPRKPFSMQRKGSYTVVPTYQRNFNLQSSKNKGSYNFGIVLLLIMSFVIVFAISSWRNYEKEKHQQEITFAKSQEDRTFKINRITSIEIL